MKKADRDRLDRIGCFAVRNLSTILQTTCRIGMAAAERQALYDQVKADLDLLERIAGTPLPQSRERLAAIAADGWAGVAA